MSKNIVKIIKSLNRISNSIDNINPETKSFENKIFDESKYFIWNTDNKNFRPIFNVNRIDLQLLIGIDNAKNTLIENTLHFAKGFNANNVLLWGSRGMGKSSLVKAVHYKINNEVNNDLFLIELDKNDLTSIPTLMANLSNIEKRFIIFCDDLSFEDTNDNYKSLKTILEGGLEGKPNNIILYATSNRRHLMPREIINKQTDDQMIINENTDEKISLSDRFGIWLGFHKCSNEDYINMVLKYAEIYKIECNHDELISEANKWSINRGSRSGRVAWQFIVYFSAKKNIFLKL